MAKRKRRFSVDDENVYGYDSRRWEEREKRGTNWEGPKRRTEKGREQEAKNRADETLGRIRPYEERRDEGIQEAEKKTKRTTIPGIYREKRKYGAEAEVRSRKASRARGQKAMAESEKASKKELADDKRRREAKEKMAKDREWRRSGGRYRERQKEMFKIPGWADWSEEKVKKFLEGGD